MVEIERTVVAVVDDDREARQSLKFLIEVMGHEAETFSSGVDFQKADLARVACIILDHHMPGMTGLELVEHLHRAGVYVPVMLITGATSPTIVARASELGIGAVAEKPLSEADLFRFIDAARSRAGDAPRTTAQ